MRSDPQYANAALSTDDTESGKTISRMSLLINAFAWIFFNVFGRRSALQ